MTIQMTRPLTTPQAPKPAPSRCGNTTCGHKRISHTGGRDCRLCNCRGYIKERPEARYLTPLELGALAESDVDAPPDPVRAFREASGPGKQTSGRQARTDAIRDLATLYPDDTLDQLAQRMGCVKNTIAAALKDLPGPGRKHTNEQRIAQRNARILAYAAEHPELAKTKIGEHFGVSGDTVGYVIRQATIRSLSPVTPDQTDDEDHERVDATRTRQHLITLITAGIDARDIAILAGRSPDSIRDIIGPYRGRPPRQHVEAGTEKAVLAIQPDQLEAIMAARRMKDGRRRTTYDPQRIHVLSDAGLTPAKIAKQLGCHKRTVVRVLDERDAREGTPR